MKAVILGAGRVALGYLGQMLRESGYAVTFVERRPEIVEAINRGGYVINICHNGASCSEVPVEGVRAISFADEYTLARELGEARLVFTAVGAGGLPHVSEVFGKALQRWLTFSAVDPLDVICCENMPDSAASVRRAVCTVVSKSEWEALRERLRFRRAMIWRIISERSLEDGVVRTRSDSAERMDVEALPSPDLLPPINGAVLRCDMEQAISEKLYGFNTGHGVAAYLGYLQGFRYVDEALRDPSIRGVVTEALVEMGRGLLCGGDPGLDLRRIADEYINRYANTQLRDLITRVARRPIQKLGPLERFVLPARAAASAGIPPWALASGIAAALMYDSPSDIEAVQLQREIWTMGIERTLTDLTGLRQTEQLAQIVLYQFSNKAAVRRVSARPVLAGHAVPPRKQHDALRVHFLLAQRVPPTPSPVLVDVYERLRARGVAVDDSIPEQTLTSAEEFTVRHDLYVLKSHTELALSVAGTLSALGARLLNPHRSCLLTQDKITCTKLLADAGVPVPRFWVTGDFELMMPLLTRCPLIAKPHRGHLGSSIHVLRSPDDLASLRPTEGPFLFQQYVESEGEDLKAYVVGEDVFAVRKQFSPASFQHFGRPAEVDARTRGIVLSCGRLLGLHVYGVDLVVTNDGPFVVDVNSFPGYKGVPGAAELIADYIYRYASQRVAVVQVADAHA